MGFFWKKIANGTYFYHTLFNAIIKLVEIWISIFYRMYRCRYRRVDDDFVLKYFLELSLHVTRICWQQEPVDR